VTASLLLSGTDQPNVPLCLVYEYERENGGSAEGCSSVRLANQLACELACIIRSSLLLWCTGVGKERKIVCG
jgi:hypothetical protein